MLVDEFEEDCNFEDSLDNLRMCGGHCFPIVEDDERRPASLGHYTFHPINNINVDTDYAK